MGNKYDSMAELISHMGKQVDGFNERLNELGRLYNYLETKVDALGDVDDMLDSEIETIKDSMKGANFNYSSGVKDIERRLEAIEVIDDIPLEDHLDEIAEALGAHLGLIDKLKDSVKDADFNRYSAVEAMGRRIDAIEVIDDIPLEDHLDLISDALNTKTNELNGFDDRLNVLEANQASSNDSDDNTHAFEVPIKDDGMNFLNTIKVTIKTNSRLELISISWEWEGIRQTIEASDDDYYVEGDIKAMLPRNFKPDLVNKINKKIQEAIYPDL